MRHIGPQAPGKRLPETGTRELEPLVGRFNGVLERMDEGVNRERQFAGALAHETRTRLAELRVLVDVERRYPSGRPIDGLLAEIGNIGGELESTVSGLLLLTRLDAGVESMQRIEVDLDSVLERQIEHVAPTLNRRGLRLDWQRLPVAGTVIADPALLAIVIGNLLGNASTYAPEGSVIVIRHEGSSLIISNAAPGLDSSDVSHFGQRFWSKHPGSEGHAGLGLALAGAAARAMDFQLAFQLDPSQQLRVVLGWGG
jgi:signal transduction histidine kinase